MPIGCSSCENDCENSAPPNGINTQAATMKALAAQKEDEASGSRADDDDAAIEILSEMYPISIEAAAAASEIVRTTE